MVIILMNLIGFDVTEYSSRLHLSKSSWLQRKIAPFLRDDRLEFLDEQVTELDGTKINKRGRIAYFCYKCKTNGDNFLTCDLSSCGAIKDNVSYYSGK